MLSRVFLPTDILLPDKADMCKWSVIACDQFTSEPEYWERVAAYVGDSPSTLRLMLPEAWLSSPERAGAAEINRCMREYLDGGVFRTIEDSYIYIERRLSDCGIRRGLLGALDLDAYDYRADSSSIVHSTEGTVEERLPPRVKVRAAAPLEMPHVVLFIDDPDFSVIDPLIYTLRGPEKLYDFELMEGGGHITGWQVGGENARRVEDALSRLASPEVLRRKYGSSEREPVVFAVGDGNHSLAAAKLCWDELKRGLTPEQREHHPARYALAELVNLHVSSVVFEPIHRVLFGTDAADFLTAAERYFAAVSRPGESVSVELVSAASSKKVAVAGLSQGELIAAADEFITGYIASHGGRVDYIHGDDEAGALASRHGGAGILLPKPDKAGLFPSLMKSGAFPPKSFSVGHARDKRYYLECRKLTTN